MSTHIPLELDDAKDLVEILRNDGSVLWTESTRDRLVQTLQQLIDRAVWPDPVPGDGQQRLFS